MGTVIFNRDKSEVDVDGKKPDNKVDSLFPSGSTSKLELYRLLVDELIKNDPDKTKVRDYCKFLKIPYSLNAATQIGTVFNRLQSLNRHAINE